MPPPTILEPEFLHVTLAWDDDDDSGNADLLRCHRWITHTVVLEPENDDAADGRYEMLYYTTRGAGSTGRGSDRLRPLRQSAARRVRRLRLDPDHLTLLLDDGMELYRINLRDAVTRPSPDTVRRFNDQCQ